MRSNRQQMQQIMEAMVNGSNQPLLDALADDVTWRWMGVNQWSRTFEGKAAVVDDLFGGVADTLESGSSVDVHQILAAGDHVVVEHTGHNRTRDGRAYDNNYCWICRFNAGLITEIREYMDTQLVTEIFGTVGQE